MWSLMGFKTFRNGERESFSHGRGRIAKGKEKPLSGNQTRTLSFKVDVLAHVYTALIQCHRELLTLALFLGYWTPNRAETICKGSASLCKETLAPGIYGIWSPFIGKSFPTQ